MYGVEGVMCPHFHLRGVSVRPYRCAHSDRTRSDESPAETSAGIKTPLRTENVS